MLPTARPPAITLLVVSLLLAASVFLSRRPYYNWDMFPYMAVVMNDGDVAFDSLHRSVYQTALSLMPPRDFDAISSRQPVLMRDAKAFEDVLPYYRVKPGYTWVARSLFYLGVNPLAATWLPSIVSYFALCLTLFFWSKTRAPALPAALFSIVIAASPLMTDLARFSSPDMMGTFVTLAGVALVMSSRPHLGMALLTLAVTIRPDAILLVFPITLTLAWARRLSVNESISWSLAGALIVAMVFTGNDLIRQYLFLEASLADRMNIYTSGLSTVFHSYLVPSVGVAMIILVSRRRARSPDFPSLLLWACIFSMVVKFLLHPYAEDRFNLSAYLLILVVGWETFSALLYPHYPARKDTKPVILREP